MRSLSLIALLAAALLPTAGAAPDTAPARTTPAPDAGVLRLAADAENRWVAFDLTPGNQIRFPVTLDGRVLTAVLDTGVSVTVLSRTSAAVDPARLRPGGQATAIGGDVAIEWMPTRAVAIGGLTRTGGGVAVTALPAQATGSGTPVDLLVGRDLLDRHALDIDYAQRRFRLIPSGRVPFAGRSAPLSVSPERRVYESEIALGGRTLTPMIVDTGDGSAITVTRDGWNAAAGVARLPTTSVVAYGIAGPVVSTLAIVPSLKVGMLEALSVEVRVEAAGGFSSTIGVAGRIGSGFLQNYRVLLDPLAGRMVFSPGPGADKAPLRSTSGLLVGFERDRLRVLHVMANGPAAASGWRTGETICTIDGAAVPADYATSRLAGWSVGTPGTSVRLGLCGGAVRTLRLARFY